MNQENLSPNTQAVLLLTAPLTSAGGAGSIQPLTPTEYKAVGKALVAVGKQPRDLIESPNAELLDACRRIVGGDKLTALLGRGLALAKAVERWKSLSIWVVCRSDEGYPKRLKARLRSDAPPLLYGRGNVRLLDEGGLAVVGSRHVDDELIAYTEDVGSKVTGAGKAIISGGARGIDQAAMRGALMVGGRVVGVLADSLERAVLNRDYQRFMEDQQLVLVSPYDPAAGFNVGNAMRRNKYIYALSDAALVVCSDLEKGGTWAGAVEQLQTLHFVPVFVKAEGSSSPGLDALRRKGARDWPVGMSIDDLAGFLEEIVRAEAVVTSEREETGLLVREDEGEEPQQTSFLGGTV